MKNSSLDAAGTVFKMDTSGNYTELHSFTNSGVAGAYPALGLITDTAGNLYGTTTHGGAYNLGTVFKLANTPQAQIADLQGVVNSFVSSGKLSAGPGHSLLEKLNAALTALNGGKATAAIQQLDAFINRVQALV